MYHSGLPSFSKRQIRECSRNSPITERDVDSVGHAVDAGDQRACSPDDQLDVDARRRCPVQRLDAGPIDERVHLQDDPGRAPRRRVLDLAIDELQESRAKRHRRDEEPQEGPLSRQPRQDVEQVAHVRADLGPAGQQPEVGVQARRPRVVVAGADVDIPPQDRAFAADHQQRLGMRLEPDEAVDDVRPGVLELPGPGDGSPARRSGP